MGLRQQLQAIIEGKLMTATLNGLPLEIVASAGRGWRMFPCKGKQPLIRDWPHQATCDVSQLEARETQFPNCNWAATTGPESGFFVVDLDGEAGLDWLKAQVDAGNELPETWSTRTARGLHLYFAWHPGLNLRSSASKLAPDVDVRGAGGYVIIPPSIHPDGPQYSEVDDVCPVSPAPLWLLERLRNTANAPAPATTMQRPWDTIPEGRRNDTLTRQGGYLRRKGLGQSEIESELLTANSRRCSPPLPESEVAAIAASVARYAAGGPDPLEIAWQTVQAVGTAFGYLGFIRLAVTLQKAREGLDVALPLLRIAQLFGVAHTSVASWRKRAVARGILKPTAQYIAHRRAGCYRVDLEAASQAIAKNTNLVTRPVTKPVTIGLVTESADSPIVTGANNTIVTTGEAATSFRYGFQASNFLDHETGVRP